MNSRQLRTARGASVRIFETGEPDSAPLVFLHGITGLPDDSRLLERLGEQHHVYAPELPGFGESLGEDLLEDMLDFALHGWDVLSTLALVERKPVLVGHSLGGMIAAEMAALAPQALGKLVLVDAFGLWLDAEPVPDVFALTPHQLTELLFIDGGSGAQLDATDPEAVRAFLVDNARRMGTAGKVLFPIPNRRVARRLYRVTVDTLVVWGELDRLMSPAYARRWVELLPDARLSLVPDVGHMLPHERPDALAHEIESFVAQSSGIAAGAA